MQYLRKHKARCLVPAAGFVFLAVARQQWAALGVRVNCYRVITITAHRCASGKTLTMRIDFSI